MRINPTCQLKVVGWVDGLALDICCRQLVCTSVGRASILAFDVSSILRERRVVATLCEQTLCIDFADNQLLIEAEALAAGNESAVFVDEGIACIYDILCGLSKAAGAIDISRNATCTLLANEREQVLILANQFICSAQIENDFSTLQSQFAARRHWSPKVLAEFDAESGLLCVEKKIASERHTLCTEVNLCVINGCSGCKPALLVKLLVVGKICLGHNTENFSSLYHNCTIHQQTTNHDGHAHQGDDLQGTCEVKELEKTLLAFLKQQLLAKKVTTAIAADAEFRKDDNFYTFTFSLYNEAFDLLDVVGAVCHLQRRNG